MYLYVHYQGQEGQTPYTFLLIKPYRHIYRPFLNIWRILQNIAPFFKYRCLFIKHSLLVCPFLYKFRFKSFKFPVSLTDTHSSTFIKPPRQSVKQSLYLPTVLLIPISVFTLPYVVGIDLWCNTPYNFWVNFYHFPTPNATVIYTIIYDSDQIYNPWPATCWQGICILIFCIHVELK